MLSDWQGTASLLTMETSTVQALKLAVISFSALSKDALHIYVGLTVFLMVALVHKRGLRSLWAVGAVLLVASLGELLDMRDDLVSLGQWRWRASLHDIVNTTVWPMVLWVLLRTKLLTIRS